jgi:hypothetical protein
LSVYKPLNNHSEDIWVLKFKITIRFQKVELRSAKRLKRSLSLNKGGSIGELVVHHKIKPLISEFIRILYDF